MRQLKILIGCEESQAVANAFRALGHEAYSCDFLPCSGGHPEYHIQGDVLEAISSRKWDIGIFFPTCTYLTGAAARWLKDQPERKSGVLVGAARRAAQVSAVEFVKTLYNCDIPHIGIENPVGHLSTLFMKPTQVIQPWQFGHGETKATCLWLKGLPALVPTEIVPGRLQRIYLTPPGPDRAKIRSKTYPGIAKAMAYQWSTYILDLNN